MSVVTWDAEGLSSKGASKAALLACFPSVCDLTLLVVGPSIKCLKGRGTLLSSAQVYQGLHADLEPPEFKGKKGATLHLYTTNDSFTTVTAHRNPDDSYSGCVSYAFLLLAPKWLHASAQDLQEENVCYIDAWARHDAFNMVGNATCLRFDWLGLQRRDALIDCDVPCRTFSMRTGEHAKYNTQEAYEVLLREKFSTLPPHWVPEIAKQALQAKASSAGPCLRLCVCQLSVGIWQLRK
eukprot:scaffold73058_cov13-Tisochrysis_lutea.AAC.1